jgi:tRNA (cmo5U34)-methyltransferase
MVHVLAVDRSFACAGWSFVAIEPAEAMFNICKARTAEGGLAERVTMHQCLLDEFEGEGGTFDGATALLVAHFFPFQGALAFYRKIGSMIKSSGLLFCADANAPSGQDFDAVLSMWRRHSLAQGMPQEKVDVIRGKLDEMKPQMWEQHEERVLLKQAGFIDVVQVFQSLIHGAFCAGKPAA